MAQTYDPVAPVNIVDGENGSESEHYDPEGSGLCLSGGGYRAMVFHLGSLWRLHEIGLLKKLDRISSVSGGSITAAVLALAWDDIGEGSDVSAFVDKVVGPVRRLAGHSIDWKAITGGILLPGSISEKVAAKYDRLLFNGRTLQDLPDKPRFVINATNVATGRLWRFSKPYMGDYKVGRVFSPTTSLAQAVAASSAFPPFLSPCVLRLSPGNFTEKGEDVSDEFRRNITLTDGGVYDNLGLETVWKRYGTVLVSDAGGGFEYDARPYTNWAGHSKRVLDLVDDQVRSLRKRLLIASYKSNRRTGAYWGIRTDIRSYELSDPLDAPFDRTTDLANTKTRLLKMPANRQERLINWGYAVCDAAIRRHYNSNFPAPGAAGLPYPERGI